ncbi:hypothetical protein L1887_39119 [Cichorium endivia]|nr:hypothetical protein L1887_39119 [Cichorium endivia]
MFRSREKYSELQLLLLLPHGPGLPKVVPSTSHNLTNNSAHIEESVQSNLILFPFRLASKSLNPSSNFVFRSESAHFQSI